MYISTVCCNLANATAPKVIHSSRSHLVIRYPPCALSLTHASERHLFLLQVQQFLPKKFFFKTSFFQ